MNEIKTIKELPFKETFSKLCEVYDGFYFGTGVFKNDKVSNLDEILSWEDSRLFVIEDNETHYRNHWVIIRKEPSVKLDTCTLWYLFSWVGSTREGELTEVSLVMHGNRDIHRYTGVERADGFDDIKGFDELIDALTSVKMAYIEYDKVPV